MKKEDKKTIPWWVLDNPGSVAKALWEQKIIKEILRRLPEDQAKFVVEGYLNGDPQCQWFFDRVSWHLSKSQWRPDSWRRAAGLRG